LAKLVNYAKIRGDVLGFCWFYARWLGNPLEGRLKAEVYQLFEKALVERGGCIIES